MEDVPSSVVIILVIDESGDAAVRIDLEVFWTLLLLLLEIQVYGLVGKTELIKEEGNFPKMTG